MSIPYRIAFYTDVKCSPVLYERQRNRTGTSWSHTSIFVPERMAVQSKDKPPPQNRVDPTILQSFSLTHRHLSINTDIFCQSQMCPSDRTDCSLCVSLKFILLAFKLRRRISSSPPLHRIYTRERVQGGKTFCASFCASLIAGSRRAFLCVDCVCLLLEF